jgi:D-threo-aldose 1-dehydrogenase
VLDPTRRLVVKSDADIVRSSFAGGLSHRAIFDYSYDGALRSFEQSLLRLGVDRIDILFIRDADVWTHGADNIEARFQQAMDGAYPALHRLREEGAIKAIGGVIDADICARFEVAGDFDLMLLCFWNSPLSTNSCLLPKKKRSA